MRRHQSSVVGRPSSDVRVLRASEIGEYNYCSRAWWYKHVAKLSPGVETAARLEVGRNAHKQHGRAVALSLRIRVLGIALLMIGLFALLLALLWR